jgi:hypothetical protein
VSTIDPASPIHRHLIGGEKVLWTGRPDPTKHFTRSDLYAIPFSLMWGGFAIFWMTMVSLEGDLFGMLWGTPFVLIGLYMIVGRFFAKAWIKKRTWYAITDKRAIEFRKSARGERVNAALLRNIPAFNHERKNNGSGAIFFGNLSFGQIMYANTGLDFFGNQGSQRIICFYDIDDIQVAADIVIRELGISSPGLNNDEHDFSGI